MPYSLILALAAMAVVLAGTPLVMALARRVGALDRPGPRRVHREPVPTLGGLAMMVAVLGVAWVARLFSGPAQILELRPLVGLTWACVPILALGLIDDLRGSSPWTKLFMQSLTAVVLFHYGFNVPVLSNPFGPPIATGHLNLVLTIGWTLVVLNAINLIDGPRRARHRRGPDRLGDAVVGGPHARELLRHVPDLAADRRHARVPALQLSPARIFMGDTGSQFLGLMLAAVSLLENRKGTATLTLLFPLAALAVPIADGVIAFARRMFHGQPVWKADSEHVHHRLIRLGLSQRDAVFVLWFVAAYSGVMAVVLANLSPAYALLLGGMLGAGLFFAFEVLRFIDRKLIARRREMQDLD